MNSCGKMDLLLHPEALLRGMENLYKKKVGLDVYFIFKECPEVKIPAHKFVLMAASDVFGKMFLAPLSEDENIEMEDHEIDSEAFQRLIKYIYSGNLQFDWENIENLLYMAHKYDISSLKADCWDFLDDNLSTNNVYRALGLADLYKNEDLLKRCCNFIVRHGSSTQRSSEGFLRLGFHLIIKIMEKGSKSPQIFKMVLKWLTHECERQNSSASPENFRLIIGEHIHLFNFSSFSPKEIDESVRPSGILSDIELYKILLEIVKKSESGKKFAIAKKNPDTLTNDWGWAPASDFENEYANDWDRPKKALWD